MKKALITLLILLLSLSVCAQTITKTELITDKRIDTVQVSAGQTFCTYRTVINGTTVSPRWNGELQIISIDKVTYTTETYTVDVPIYKTCLNETTDKEQECFVEYVKEERTRQIPNYTPIKADTVDKSSTATEVNSKLTADTAALTKEASSQPISNGGVIRFCFQAPTLEQIKAGAQRTGSVSYVAYNTTAYDVCRTTIWETVTYCYQPNATLGNTCGAVAGGTYNWTGADYPPDSHFGYMYYDDSNTSFSIPDASNHINYSINYITPEGVNKTNVQFYSLWGIGSATNQNISVYPDCIGATTNISVYALNDASCTADYYCINQTDQTYEFIVQIKGGGSGEGCALRNQVIGWDITVYEYMTVNSTTPTNNTIGSENNSFSGIVVGANQTYGNCSLYFNNTLNQSLVAENNTEFSFNISLLGAGEWLWNITCWRDADRYNSTETRLYTVNTTVTTTTSSTTTTQATATTNSTLYIYAIMLPIMAFIMTLTIIIKSEQPLIIVFKPIIASILWFASSGMTTNIRFIDDFTVSLATYYIDKGNPEVGYLFAFLAGVMGFYTIIVLLIIIYEHMDGSKEDKHGSR